MCQKIYRHVQWVHPYKSTSNNQTKISSDGLEIKDGARSSDGARTMD
jgi:hypothetical protein